MDKTIDELKELFVWARCEKKKDRDVNVYAESGEVYPAVWNNLSPELPDMLREGVYLQHLFGPILATQGGQSIILQNFIDFPNVIKYRMLWTYSHKHWLLISSVGKEDKSIRFILRVEEYHAPLSENHSAKTIKFLSEKDAEAYQKRIDYYGKLKEFEIAKFGSVPIERLKDIIHREYEELKQIQKITQDKGTYFEALDADTLLSLK